MRDLRDSFLNKDSKFENKDSKYQAKPALSNSNIKISKNK